MHYSKSRKSLVIASFLIILIPACGSPTADSQPPQTSVPLTLPPTWTPSPPATAIPTFTQIPTFTPVPAFTPLAYPTNDALGALLERFQQSLFPPRGQWAAYREPDGIKVVNAETTQVWTLPCELFDECSILFPIKWSRNGQILYFAPASSDSGAPPGIYLFTALAMIDVESCGKSRVNLGGLAEELHRRNVRALYKQISAELGPITHPDPAAAKRAFDAMMQMGKIDVAAIEAALRG